MCITKKFWFKIGKISLRIRKVGKCNQIGLELIDDHDNSGPAFFSLSFFLIIWSMSEVRAAVNLITQVYLFASIAAIIWKRSNHSNCPPQHSHSLSLVLFIFHFLWCLLFILLLLFVYLSIHFSFLLLNLLHIFAVLLFNLFNKVFM